MRKTLALLLAGAFLACAPAQAESSAAGILILGDSNSEGPFGGALYNALRALRDPVSGQPVNVGIFAKCGAGANDWLSRADAKIDCGAWACGDGKSLRDCRHFKGGYIPPLRDLYDGLPSERRVTLVILGLNMLIGDRAAKLRDATRLIDAIHAQHSACIWIGPPQPADLFVDPDIYDSFNSALKRTVTRDACRYIDSSLMTDRRNLGRHTRDNHYGQGDAEAWARKVIAELAHPANRADKPLLTLLGDPLSTPAP